MPVEPPCGPSQALCDVDQCDGDGCAFVQIGQLPPDVGGLLADEDAVYVLADSSETLYRIPKCGGQPNVVARATSGIGSFAVLGSSVFWSLGNNGGTGPLYRTLSDGSATAVVDVPSTSIAAIVADASAAFVFSFSAPGIVRLDGSGASTLLAASAGNIVAQDDSTLYFQGGETGAISWVNKLDGSTNTLLAANLGRVSGANSSGPYVSLYMSGSRPWRRLVRMALTGGDTVMVRDLASTMTGTVDEHCGYFVDKQGIISATAFRFPLGGGSAEVLHRAVSLNLALSSDTVYLVAETGGVFRRPK